MSQFLKKNKIKYRRYDIERDREAHRRYKKMGGNGVPVVRIGSRVIHGYNPNAVMAAVNR